MKRILTILLVLCSLASFGQSVPGHFAPIASPYDYQWIKARYLELPKDTLTGAGVGAVAVKNGAFYVNTGTWQPLGAGGGGGSYFAGSGLTLSGSTFKADTVTLATRLRLYKALDSLKATLPAGGSTYTFSSPLQNTSGTVSMTQANGSNNGYLSAVDWTLFNSKVGQGALNDTAAALRAFIAATPTGIASLNGATTSTQTFDFSTASGTMGWVSDAFTGTHTLRIPIATASDAGLISTTTQTFGGRKTFNGGINITTAQQTADTTAWKPLVRHSSGVVAQGYWIGSGSGTGNYINNGTTTQTADFNISGGGVMGGNLDVTGHGNFAQNRVQLYHATSGGATLWYNTSGDAYAETNPDQGGFMSSRRFVFNSAVGDPIAGTDYKGYLYMKGGVPWWSYNGTHTAIPLGGGGSSYEPTITTQATSTTLSTAYETWVFTGSSAATFTLPATGTRYVIKSRGTGTLTVSGTLFSVSATSSLTIYPGESATFHWDGTYWIVY